MRCCLRGRYELNCKIKLCSALYRLAWRFHGRQQATACNRQASVAAPRQRRWVPIAKLAAHLEALPIQLLGLWNADLAAKTDTCR